MASSKKKNDNDDSYLEMSPEKAKKLFATGGFLIAMNLPVGSVFGIDMKVYHIGDKFHGLKMIPPGLHFIYYSTVSKEGCVAPRTGFFHHFKSKEILVTKWDGANEALNVAQSSDEELQRIRDNLLHLDSRLGAYPYQILKQWKCLTCNISESLINKLQPLSGVVSSVTELVPLDYPLKGSTEPDSTSDKKFQSLEDRYLPDMKKVPGTEIRFTAIPTAKFCTKAQVDF